MLPARTMPAGYVLGGTVTLRRNRSLILWLGMLSIPWTVVTCFGVGLVMQLARPRGWEFVANAGAAFGFFLGCLAVLPVTLILHEAVHGVVLAAITRSRPVFGFKGWYLYTDAPGWYLSRGQMLAVLVAPLVVIPAVGLPIVAFGPAVVSLLAFAGLIVNSVGAMGDLYMMWSVARIRGPVVFGDTPDAEVGEAGSWFIPAG